MPFLAFATEFWPLIDIRIQLLFFFNILRTNGQNLTKFCIHMIDKLYIGIVKHHVLKICNRVTALVLCQNLFLLNILRMNGQNLTKF